MKKIKFILFHFFIISSICVFCQNNNIIRYDANNLKDVQLNYVFKPLKNDLKNPLKGGYAPYMLADNNRKLEKGVCNYVILPLKNFNEIGKQYSLKLCLKVNEAYVIDSFAKSHIGITTMNKVPAQNWAIWDIDFYNFQNLNSDSINVFQFDYRILCKANYLVVGVFRNPDYPDEPCDFCWYDFEVISCEISESKDATNDCNYFCDIESERKIHKAEESSTGIETYFDLNSFVVNRNDSIALVEFLYSKNSSKDLIILEASTDKIGNENIQLGLNRANAVKNILLKNGILQEQIVIYNFSDTKSKDLINPKERKVKVHYSQNKIFNNLYSFALESLAKNDFKETAIILKKWLKEVPYQNAIYHLFDCRFDEFYKQAISKTFLQNFKNRFYKNRNSVFQLDSLWCEDQRNRTLDRYVRGNEKYDRNSPIAKDSCFNSSYNYNNEKECEKFVEKYIEENGIPTINEVTLRGQEALLYIIIHSKDISFQKKYLPIVKESCENGITKWQYYALLYDKIGVKEYNTQRYGTQYRADEKGTVLGMYPLEDKEHLNEWRKQVKLAPITNL